MRRCFVILLLLVFTLALPSSVKANTINLSEKSILWVPDGYICIYNGMPQSEKDALGISDDEAKLLLSKEQILVAYCPDTETIITVNVQPVNLGDIDNIEMISDYLLSKLVSAFENEEYKSDNIYRYISSNGLLYYVVEGVSSSGLPVVMYLYFENNKVWAFSMFTSNPVISPYELYNMRLVIDRVNVSQKGNEGYFNNILMQEQTVVPYPNITIWVPANYLALYSETPKELLDQYGVSSEEIDEMYEQYSDVINIIDTLNYRFIRVTMQPIQGVSDILELGDDACDIIETQSKAGGFNIQSISTCTLGDMLFVKTQGFDPSGYPYVQYFTIKDSLSCILSMASLNNSELTATDYAIMSLITSSLQIGD